MMLNLILKNVEVKDKEALRMKEHRFLEKPKQQSSLKI